MCMCVRILKEIDENKKGGKELGQRKREKKKGKKKKERRKEEKKRAAGIFGDKEH